MALPPMSKRDAEQVLRYAFDDATGRLRVDAVAVIGPGGISAADGDNIAISDGTDTMAVNPDGSINTAISGDVQIEISAADGDNVAISDGVHTVDVNPDGSLNVNVTGGELAIEISAADGDNVAISDGTNTLDINPDGSINSVVTATDLDIRDLDATQDNIAISDGTDTLSINTDGSINTTDITVSASSAVTSVSVPTASTTLLAANSSRKNATFYNDSGGVIFLKLGSTASSTSFTVRLTSNDYYELPFPVYTGIITAIAASGTRDIRITELT